LPFNELVFGLLDPYGRGIRVFRVEKYVHRNDPIILVWRRSKSWLTGRYICIQTNKDGTRRVAMQTLGWDEAGITSAPTKGQKEFEWYDLGPNDLIAVEVGSYYPKAGSGGFEGGRFPETHKAVEAPELGEWESRQKFLIPSPPSGPWPTWDTLTVDPFEPIGPKSWVAGFDISANGFRRPYLGQVKNLQQTFTITDVRTGKDVNMGSNGRIFYGAVVGRSRSMLDRKKRKRAARGEMEKVAKKAKRSAKAGARSTSKAEA
jgi:hypothetical protein